MVNTTPLNQNPKDDEPGLENSTTPIAAEGAPHDTAPVESAASVPVSAQPTRPVWSKPGLILAGGIVAAGGIIAQLLPGADETTIAALEANAAAMLSVTTQIAEGATCEDLLVAITGTLGLHIFRDFEVAFKCRCTREKVESV